MGEVEEARSCLLFVVVMRRGWSMRGRRAWMVCTTSVMGVVALRGTERVRGRPRPAKEVRRMLTAWVGVVEFVGCAGSQVVGRKAQGTAGSATDMTVFGTCVDNRCGRNVFGML